MFKETITVTDLKSANELLKELKYGEAIQVVHRNSHIKVIITQEEYLDLRSKARLVDYEPSQRGEGVIKSFAEIKGEWSKSSEKIDRLLAEEEA